ncbi:unnamed protein product [Rotaria magnacalcarata]|uniref:Interferon-related developmental regulator N-terminal domain-containing protein n=1 Tax=Rotaria magnacalcarata TaxID=392030 RepID=A0A8S2NJ27_9BILA|nr:unnamed protein product [Rotaria magnacalcarata]
MPKYTKKNRPPRSTMAKSGADDCASIDDGVSLCSNISDGTSIYDDSEIGFSSTPDLIISSDSLDEKLDMSIEGLRNKDSRTREDSLRTLQALFSQKYIYDLVSSRSENLTEQLAICLRKSNESEGRLAAIVTSLFVIQLGETSDELYTKFRDAIMPILRDESKSSILRKHFAKAIGIICFIACEDISMTVELMKALETIFSRSYLNGDGISPILNHDLQDLHTAALSSWCLLENGFLRSIFNLEELDMEEIQQSKGNRLERQLANRSAFKIRTQALNKTRANKVTRSQYDD